MPSVSKAMQQMMAIGEHDPDALYPENKGILKMGKKKLHEYASTKRAGLPKHKKKSNAIRSLMDGDAEVAKKIAKGK